MIGKRANNMLLKLGQPMSLSYELLRVYSVYGFSFAHPTIYWWLITYFKKNVAGSMQNSVYITPNIFLMIRILQLSTL